MTFRLSSLPTIQKITINFDVSENELSECQTISEQFYKLVTFQLSNGEVFDGVSHLDFNPFGNSSRYDSHQHHGSFMPHQMTRESNLSDMLGQMHSTNIYADAFDGLLGENGPLSDHRVHLSPQFVRQTHGQVVENYTNPLDDDVNFDSINDGPDCPSPVRNNEPEKNDHQSPVDDESWSKSTPNEQTTNEPTTIDRFDQFPTDLEGVDEIDEPPEENFDGVTITDLVIRYCDCKRNSKQVPEAIILKIEDYVNDCSQFVRDMIDKNKQHPYHKLSQDLFRFVSTKSSDDGKTQVHLIDHNKQYRLMFHEGTEEETGILMPVEMYPLGYSLCCLYEFDSVYNWIDDWSDDAFPVTFATIKDSVLEWFRKSEIMAPGLLFRFKDEARGLIERYPDAHNGLLHQQDQYNAICRICDKSIKQIKDYSNEISVISKDKYIQGALFNGVLADFERGDTIKVEVKQGPRRSERSKEPPTIMIKIYHSTTEDIESIQDVGEKRPVPSNPRNNRKRRKKEDLEVENTDQTLIEHDIKMNYIVPMYCMMALLNPQIYFDMKSEPVKDSIDNQICANPFECFKTWSRDHYKLPN